MFFTGLFFFIDMFFFTCFIETLFFWFTCCLHVSYRPPILPTGFFFYIFHTGCLFSFTCFLFLFVFLFVCFFFTYFIQDPFLHLHVFLHVSYKPPFFIYMIFTCFIQAHFFLLHVFYMFLTGPLFSFTWLLQVFKRSISRLCVAFGRIIYTFLQGLVKPFTCFLLRKIL